ncbi:hypothetical protein [Herbidospora cretacea]|uniref:hypothetical protein n=1 Tax=Herbidospora cretacea TaxID=28444 RepID=UPI0007743868|nr:hypothetical protein [Herbidospora cretacea]
MEHEDEEKEWEMPETLKEALRVAEAHISDVQENTAGERLSERDAAEELMKDILAFLYHTGEDADTSLAIARERARAVTGL